MTTNTGKPRQNLWMATAAIAALFAFASQAHGQERSSSRATISINSQNLGDALRAFAQQTGTQVVFDPGLLAGKSAPAVNGTLAPEDALRRLLAGSDLTYESTAAGTYTIFAEETKAHPTRAGVSQPAQSDSDVEEIIVTSQKKSERLQDVPVSVTVLDPVVLAENGQNRLIDYFATVPGLSLSSTLFGGGAQYLTIRGLSTGYSQNPTVAAVIDDVPVGSSTQLAFGMFGAPDLDPSDLARIEVLKGPQGALYGADSLGGLIRYVTADPSTAAFRGRVELDGVDVPAGGTGYGLRGALNIPLADELAIRVSGFVRRDPGYIDNLTTDQKDLNWASVYGGRFSALWRLSDDVSLKVSALLQQTDAQGSAFIASTSSGQPTLGDLKQTGAPGSTPYAIENQLYSAVFKAKLDNFEFISVTGYSVNKFVNWLDVSQTFGPFALSESFGVPGVSSQNHYVTDKFSQELRVSSSIGDWLNWLAGGFYTHENSPDTFQVYYAENLSTGAIAGTMFLANYSPITLDEYAVFGDLTAHITDQLDLQIGGRQSWNHQSYGSMFIGPLAHDLYGASPFVNPLERASGDAFTYLATLQYKFFPDLMLYARIATGYRIGGPNLVAYPGAPSSYRPDTTTNYEIGIKGDLLNHQLSFDLAAYYIDWKDFQLAVSGIAPNGNSYFTETNGGGAKSEGFEVSVRARPVSGMTVTAQGSYNDAVLTQDLPPGAVAAGAYGLASNSLPYSIRWSGGITVDQEFPLLE